MSDAATSALRAPLPKVLLIHQHGSPHGSGAVIAMYRLHRALQAAGVESTIGCRKRNLEGDDVVELPPPAKIERHLSRITWRLGLREIHCVSSFKIAEHPAFLEADVVNIHGWHTNWFSYLALPKLSRVRPIVGTLHDMWNFTGHCAYSYGCERWRTGCGKCPHLDTHPAITRDGTKWEWKLKARAYRRSNMHVVAPSEVVCEMARESMMGHYPIHRIPNPIDTNVYRPGDRDEARDMLGLPRDRPVLLFISMSLTDTVKGGDLLTEALRRLPQKLRRDAVLLALGNHGEAYAAASDMTVRALGYVTDETLKIRAYRAADAMLLPSRFENQSLVMIESMACGIPVVSFDVGGLGELVTTGETGYLAKGEDVDDFSSGITYLLDDDARRATMSTNARALIEREHGLDVHVERYLDVYRSAMRGFNDSPF